MIQLQGAGKRFGHKLLFEGCDWLITPRERTGLVGGNGTGKSTILKILCGMESLDYGSVADRLHHIDSEFRNHDGYAIEAQVGTVLDGLGFRKEDWTRRTEEFSGGWQMRLALAKLLLEKPNLLLLDEPTNHLHLEARNWLESYLTNYPYAAVPIAL